MVDIFNDTFNKNAAFYLGLSYYEGIIREQNYKEAKKLFEYAASKNEHSEALFYLGYFIMNFF